MTIKTMLASDALDPLDLNCAEKILYAANEAYGLGLDPRALRLAAGFGGGLGCGLTCGALSGGAMALSCLCVRQRAHESGRIKALCGELAARLQAQLGAADCAALKPRYHRPDAGCKTVILAAAGILDEIIERENMGSHQEEAE